MLENDFGIWRYTIYLYIHLNDICGFEDDKVDFGSCLSPNEYSRSESCLSRKK